jgi:hypothetical protein
LGLETKARCRHQVNIAFATDYLCRSLLRKIRAFTELEGHGGPIAMRWVGIDEAGYGPNLGPLVMTAVVAEGPDDRPPDIWGDLPDSVSRAGGPPDGLWVDDSKKIYRAGQGLDRLETASLSALASAGCAVPESLAALLGALEAGSADEVELTIWLDGQADPVVPRADTRPMLEQTLAKRPFEGAPWRIVAVRSVVLGPARFNEAMGLNGSKAKAHFSAFRHLLVGLWEQAGDGVVTHVRADKHGGRHFYLEPLYDAIPDAWIDRGAEGPDASHYTVRQGGRRLELCLQPRADSEDGLVALASIVSKTVRELWMHVFNAYWLARIPELRPTAGYPGDSGRFREAIEPHCRACGLEPDVWWRAK